MDVYLSWPDSLPRPEIRLQVDGTPFIWAAVEETPFDEMPDGVKPLRLTFESLGEVLYEFRIAGWDLLQYGWTVHQRRFFMLWHNKEHRMVRVYQTEFVTFDVEGELAPRRDS